LTRALEARAGGGGRATLASTYFDTSDHALARRGLTLRVREQGGKFVQTVKATARVEAAGLARGEWEDPVAGPRPDPEAPETGRFLDPEIGGRNCPPHSAHALRRRSIAVMSALPPAMPANRSGKSNSN
jgi:hypothetical protein